MKFHIKTLEPNQFTRLQAGLDSVDGLDRNSGHPLLLINCDSTIKTSDLIGINEVNDSYQVSGGPYLTGRSQLIRVIRIINDEQWYQFRLTLLLVHIMPVEGGC